MIITGFDANSDEELRQILYREELRKQIEEKQKLEAIKREKEKLEEAMLEARVQKQQEEMIKQYEEELARRTAIQQKVNHCFIFTLDSLLLVIYHCNITDLPILYN